MIATPPHPNPAPIARKHHRHATIVGPSVFERWVGHQLIRCIIDRHGETCYIVARRP